jgi:DNA-binding IclR family transcriptional regulator
MSAVKHTINIVNFLAHNRGPQKITDISKALNVSSSTVHRILSSLKNAEWVVQDHVTRKYEIGTCLLEFALSLSSQVDLKDVSLPFLRLLNSEVKEAVMLSARVGFEKIYIEQIRSNYELQHIVELGKRLPLWAGASGKAILAYLKKEEIENVMRRLKRLRIRVLASGQLIDVEKLRQELVEIRDRGFSISKGERIAWVNSVAAPIFDSSHRVVGAISIGGPEPRFGLELAIRYGPSVRESANNISIQIGGLPHLRMRPMWQNLG